MSDSVSSQRKKEKQREAKRHKAQRDQQRNNVTSQHILEEIAKLDRASRQHPNGDNLRQRRIRLVADLEAAQAREREAVQADHDDDDVTVEGLDLIIANDAIKPKLITPSAPVVQSSNHSNKPSIIKPVTSVRPWLDSPPDLTLNTPSLTAPIHHIPMPSSAQTISSTTISYHVPYQSAAPVVPHSSHFYGYHASYRAGLHNQAVDPMLAELMTNESMKHQKTTHPSSVAGRVSSFVASLGKHHRATG